MTERADDNGPFKEFTFGSWLRDGLDEMYCQSYGQRFRIDASGFQRHMRNSAREQLLAVRSIIDDFIERIDEAQAEADAGGAQADANQA